MAVDAVEDSFVAHAFILERFLCPAADFYCRMLSNKEILLLFHEFFVCWIHDQEVIRAVLKGFGEYFIVLLEGFSILLH